MPYPIKAESNARSITGVVLVEKQICGSVKMSEFQSVSSTVSGAKYGLGSKILLNVKKRIPFFIGMWTPKIGKNSVMLQ